IRRNIGDPQVARAASATSGGRKVLGRKTPRTTLEHLPELRWCGTGCKEQKGMQRVHAFGGCFEVAGGRLDSPPVPQAERAAGQAGKCVRQARRQLDRTLK